MISGVILVNMKTLCYRWRRQWLYVLPGHCAILTQLHAFKDYVHAPVLLQSLNRWSLAGPLNVITGSSESLTDTYWGPGMTRGPRKSHYHQVTYLKVEQDVQSHTIFITYPAVSLHHPRGQTVWRQMAIHSSSTCQSHYESSGELYLLWRLTHTCGEFKEYFIVGWCFNFLIPFLIQSNLLQLYVCNELQVDIILPTVKIQKHTILWMQSSVVGNSRWGSGSVQRLHSPSTAI